MLIFLTKNFRINYRIPNSTGWVQKNWGLPVAVTRSLSQRNAPGTSELCYVNILLFRSPGGHTRQLKKGLRPFRAYIQFVDYFTGRCPVLLIMPLQGNDFYVSLSPDKGVSISAGHRPAYQVEGSTKSPEGAQAIDQIITLTRMPGEAAWL